MVSITLHVRDFGIIEYVALLIIVIVIFRFVESKFDRQIVEIFFSFRLFKGKVFLTSSRIGILKFVSLKVDFLQEF